MIAPKPQRELFTRLKRPPARRKPAVTIAIGFKCSDGVVLAADTQITWQDSHKYYERKLRPHFDETRTWNATFTFAGDPALWKSFNEKFRDAMALTQTVPVTASRIRDVIETVLQLFDVLHRDPMNLNLLCAVSVPGDTYQLYKTQGHTIHEVHGYEYVGCGDSSILRFLGPLLTAPPPVSLMDQHGYIVRQAVTIATYLVMKAKTYVDGCGGDTDVWAMRPDGAFAVWDQTKIYKIEQMMLMLEHHMKHVATHFFDRRFSDEQLAQTLEFLVSRLKSDHHEFQVPVDRFML